MADTTPPEPLDRRFPALRRLAFTRRRTIPYVQQTTASDCGAASLTMVLAFHGKHLRLDDVRKITGYGRDGADALALINAGRVFGLRGRGVKIDEIDDLRFLDRGAILHWQFSHFVVFDRLHKGGAELVDPSVGRRWVSREELERRHAAGRLADPRRPGMDLVPRPPADRAHSGSGSPRGSGRGGRGAVPRRRLRRRPPLVVGHRLAAVNRPRFRRTAP